MLRAMDKPGRVPRAALEGLGRIHRASDAAYERSSEVFRTQLQAMVDEWIASGTDAGGVHTPRNRDIERAPNASQAVFELGRRPPVPAEIDDPVADARSAAARMFRYLAMDPKMYYRIARCAKCGDYFFWKKPKREYKLSRIYCENCRKAAGSGDRKRKERDKFRDKWLGVAARALNTWRSSETLKREFPSPVPYITERLKRHDLKQASVTRNLEEIEDRADQMQRKGR